MKDAAERVVERGVRLLEVLATSYARVEAGTADEAEVSTWHTFWLALLGEYDQVVGDLRAEAGEDAVGQ